MQMNHYINIVLQRDINLQEMFTTLYGKKLYSFVRNNCNSDKDAKENVSQILEEVIEKIHYSFCSYMNFSKSINENLAILHDLCIYSNKPDELENKLKSIFVLPQNFIRIISERIIIDSFSKDFHQQVLNSYYAVLNLSYNSLKDQNLLHYLQNIKPNVIDNFINSYSMISENFAIAIDIYLLLLTSVNKDYKYLELLQNKNLLEFIIKWDLNYLSKDFILSYIVFDELVD